MTGYYLELLTPETMKLIGSTKSKTTNDENGENVPHLEITEVVLIHCNIGNNDYQQDSRVQESYIHLFLIIVWSIVRYFNFIFLKTFNSEFLYIEVWFTDQICRDRDRR